MKKTLLLAGFISLALAFGVSGNVNAQTANEHPPIHTPPSSMVDGVEVPFKALDYAQMKYQGYAVTKVKKAIRGGETVYNLRVDRDDIADDFNSYFLIYDMKWNLLDDQKMVSPPIKKPEKQPDQKPESDQNSIEQNNDRKEELDEEVQEPRDEPDTSGTGDDDTTTNSEPETDTPTGRGRQPR